MTNEEQSPISEPKRPSKLGAWFLAARPKTLAAASMPVVVALSLAWSDMTDLSDEFRWTPAVCCFCFALLAQVAANFINDYADFKRGTDGKERKGPARAVASGWISPRAMLTATFLTLALACCFGLATLPYGGWRLIVVGAVSCVFCLLYSAGPLPLAYIGLGDALVVAFFGFVAVGFTYYLQRDEITLDAALVGIAVGFAVDSILIANNYRDRDEDRVNRKFTLIALFGERFGRYFYLASGLIVVALLSVVFLRRDALFNTTTLGALVVYLCFHFQAWRTLVRIRTGRALVKVLELSSRNVVVLGVLLAFALPA
jgi:1,4-dihydroxy-2-naphthoate octaprenyltransferase